MESDASDSARPQPGPRWWPAVVIVSATVAVLLVTPYLGMRFDIPSTQQTITMLVGYGIGWALFVIWLAAFSRFRLRTRLWATGVFLGLCGLFWVFVKLEGLSGSMAPRFVWRFARPRQVNTSIDDLLDPVLSGVDLTSTTPHDFPQFLGPQRTPILGDVAVVRDWSQRPPRELWRREVGSGWSSFAVVGEFAVTQEQRAGQEWVVCYHVPTGAIQWIYVDDEVFVSMVAGDGPRATPTIDEGRVYTLSALGRLRCLDGASGHLIWQYDCVDEYIAGGASMAPEWGKSCSPLILGDRVLVTGGNMGPSLLALDKHTGDIVWTAGNAGTGYSSPLVATLAGRRQIVSFNLDSVSGHAVEDGRQLWMYPWQKDRPNVAQPVPVGGSRLFISTGYGVGCALLELQEIEGGRLRCQNVWRNRNLKAKFTNVVFAGDVIYGLDEGILVCLDVASGKRRWKRGRYGHGQMLLLDDVLLISAEDGRLVLVEATPAEHRELASMAALSDKTWNNPVVAGRYLLVRNHREAACYELPLVDSD